MLQDVQDTAVADRRSRILDAAERCFVRAGFHRTTMQDVAAEAGMSPGNLYRYFPSKDAIVIGLTERDRSDVARDFATFDGGGDFMTSFIKLGRKHFEEEPRERAVLCLEIWAEATRNPAFAEMTGAFHRELSGHMIQVFTEAQRRGAIAPNVDPAALALLIMTLANGLFVRRAVAGDFDAKREVAQLMAVIEAAFCGRIELGGSPTPDTKPESAR